LFADVRREVVEGHTTGGAGDAGFRKGDLIVAVNKAAIDSPVSLRRALNEQTSTPTTVKILRGADALKIALPTRSA
jgi:S1-C subfamily serine protease